MILGSNPSESVYVGRMIEEIKVDIKRSLAKAVNEAFQISKSEDEIPVEIQSNPKFGEFSSSICFELSRETGKTQKEVADAIISNFEKPDFVAEIDVLEARGMHYLDFFLDFPTFGNRVLRKVLESKDEYGRSDSKKGERDCSWNIHR